MAELSAHGRCRRRCGFPPLPQRSTFPRTPSGRPAPAAPGATTAAAVGGHVSSLHGARQRGKEAAAAGPRVPPLSPLALRACGGETPAPGSAGKGRRQPCPWGTRPRSAAGGPGTRSPPRRAPRRPRSPRPAAGPRSAPIGRAAPRAAPRRPAPPLRRLPRSRYLRRGRAALPRSRAPMRRRSARGQPGAGGGRVARGAARRRGDRVGCGAAGGGRCGGAGPAGAGSRGAAGGEARRGGAQRGGAGLRPQERLRGGCVAAERGVRCRRGGKAPAPGGVSCGGRRVPEVFVPRSRRRLSGPGARPPGQAAASSRPR